MGFCLPFEVVLDVFHQTRPVTVSAVIEGRGIGGQEPSSIDLVRMSRAALSSSSDRLNAALRDAPALR